MGCSLFNDLRMPVALAVLWGSTSTHTTGIPDLALRYTGVGSSFRMSRVCIVMLATALACTCGSVHVEVMMGPGSGAFRVAVLVVR